MIELTQRQIVAELDNFKSFRWQRLIRQARHREKHLDSFVFGRKPDVDDLSAAKHATDARGDQHLGTICIIDEIQLLLMLVYPLLQPDGL